LYGEGFVAICGNTYKIEVIAPDATPRVIVFYEEFSDTG